MCVACRLCVFVCWLLCVVCCLRLHRLFAECCVLDVVVLIVVFVCGVLFVVLSVWFAI